MGGLAGTAVPGWLSAKSGLEAAGSGSRAPAEGPAHARKPVGWPAQTTPATREEAQPGEVGAGADPGHAGHRRATATASPADTSPGIGQQHHQ